MPSAHQARNRSVRTTVIAMAGGSVYDARVPMPAALPYPGGALAADGDRAVFGQRSSGGHLRLYIMQRLPADWIFAAGPDVADTAALQLARGGVRRSGTEHATARARRRRR
jgi:hypothetical protein